MGRKLSLGAVVVLLALNAGGCRGREPVQRTTPAAPPPAAQGPVNPDAGVTAYACAARVRVDPATGAVKVEKLDLVADCGTVVSPTGRCRRCRARRSGA